MQALLNILRSIGRNIYPWGNVVPPGSGLTLALVARLALQPFDSLSEGEKLALAYAFGQTVSWTAQAHGALRAAIALRNRPPARQPAPMTTLQRGHQTQLQPRSGRPTQLATPRQIVVANNPQPRSGNRFATRPTPPPVDFEERARIRQRVDRVMIRVQQVLEGIQEPPRPTPAQVTGTVTADVGTPETQRDVRTLQRVFGWISTAWSAVKTGGKSLVGYYAIKHISQFLVDRGVGGPTEDQNALELQLREFFGVVSPPPTRVIGGIVPSEPEVFQPTFRRTEPVISPALEPLPVLTESGMWPNDAIGSALQRLAVSGFLFAGRPGGRILLNLVTGTNSLAAFQVAWRDVQITSDDVYNDQIAAVEAVLNGARGLPLNGAVGGGMVAGPDEAGMLIRAPLITRSGSIKLLPPELRAKAKRGPGRTHIVTLMGDPVAVFVRRRQAHKTARLINELATELSAVAGFDCDRFILAMSRQLNDFICNPPAPPPECEPVCTCA